MHKKWFGDAYTYTHRALIHGIAPPCEWLVHPMLFYTYKGEEAGGGLDTREYADFLGLPDSSVLNGNKRKKANLESDVSCHTERHLFLDPDTGIAPNASKKSTRHLTIPQVRRVAKGRPGKVVLVFDHAYHDGGKARDKVQCKLERLADKTKLFGAAVIVREHRCVCYILVSTCKHVIEEKTGRLRARLKIPYHRLVVIS